MTPRRFEPPQKKEKHNAQITVHLHSAMKEEILALCETLGYAVKNDFYKHLLMEGITVARKDVARLKT